MNVNEFINEYYQYILLAILAAYIVYVVFGRSRGKKK